MAPSARIADFREGGSKRHLETVQVLDLSTDKVLTRV